MNKQEPMLTEEEVEEIVLGLDSSDVVEMVREIYRRGYKKAVADMLYLDDKGVIIQ